MDLREAEHRLRKLQTQRDRGKLAEETFRVEVAKLLFRDEQGVFWMLDPDTGEWFCNRGANWEPADPHSKDLHEPAQEAGRGAGRRRPARWIGLAVAVIALLALAGIVVLRQVPLDVPWNPFRPTPVPGGDVQVMIASPTEGSEVFLGQAVAVESTIEGAPNLQAVARVALQVNGQTVDVQSLLPKVQPEQSSFPLSQPWLPDTVGEYEVTVVAFSSDDEALGTATIFLEVKETSSEAVLEPACMPDATFDADVTIPPDTVFPPGVRMDKVWQVRNSGSCAWGVGYELVQTAGQDLSAPDAVPVPPTAAGDLADLAITLWAPLGPGTYASVWQLRSPDGDLFGPALPLTITVEALAQESPPPAAPTGLRASITEDGSLVRLAWSDRSDNEDAFRIYRSDVEASIALAPANTEQFVDRGVACGNTYRYLIVAFNAAGSSAISATAEVALPPCAPANVPPTLTLTVVPTQVQASETFTVAFEADDDLGLDLVVVWGEETGDPALDAGRIFTCTRAPCAASWPVTWTQEASVTLTLSAVALDSSGQESEPARTTVTVYPPGFLPISTTTPISTTLPVTP
jgi:hypothetical protein